MMKPEHDPFLWDGKNFWGDYIELWGHKVSEKFQYVEISRAMQLNTSQQQSLSTIASVEIWHRRIAQNDEVWTLAPTS